MAFSTQAQFRDTYGVSSTAADGGKYFAAPANGFPTAAVAFSAGTGAGQINKTYIETFALTNGGTTTRDLTAVTYAGTTQTFTAVKRIQAAVIATTTADTNPKVILGPQGVANGAILCFGGTTGKADVYNDFRDTSPVTGWAVTSGNKVVQITNNGTFPVTVSLMMLGTG